MTAQLKEKLGPFSAVMVVVSAMIGSGVFKKISLMSDDLHSAYYVLLAWLCAGLITLMGSLSNAEVAGLISKPGGQYVYFREMYGDLFAFLFGWASFSVIQTGTAASVAYVFAESVNHLIPLPVLPDSIANITWLEIGDFQLQPFYNFGVKLLTCGLIILLSAINFFGIDYGEKISNIIGSTVVLGVLLIVVFGFLHTPDIEASEVQSGTKGFAGSSLFFSAMLAAFWAFEGWNNVGFLGGEIKNPKKNIPLALMLGTGVVLALYLLVNGAYLHVSGVENLAQMAHEENIIPAVGVMEKIVSGGGMLISILILMSTFNSTNNSVMTAPRIYYQMAEDGLSFKTFGGIHPKYRTPYKAILFQMIWCLVLIISGSFDMLTELLVFVAFIFYGCGAIGVIVLRKKMKDEHRPFKVPLYPFIPILFAVFSLVLIVNTLIESPVNSIIGLLLVLAGLPLYFYFKKTKGKA